MTIMKNILIPLLFCMKNIHALHSTTSVTGLFTIFNFSYPWRGKRRVFRKHGKDTEKFLLLSSMETLLLDLVSGNISRAWW